MHPAQVPDGRCECFKTSDTINDLGLKKLPAVKSLQDEYAKLLAEKKASYPEYRQARDEMRELLTIQSNVDRILGTDAREAEKEKEQERR